ncbi:MAG: dienelactone hydrolase family protein [Chryseobacterium sp.]|jgi:dienelactone hydrolase|uniref:dienelactone hydrolase family protein n=1 Tax=Chryseobacterium sp. TaxID=1871047 RepID=UPI00282FF456|nr:dienelactone hydrolase family protein [Chryseobacterium sp.]MDR2237887.1 dienelactone hydrolase family protein [Chryseobacterium sp.]
MKKLLTGILLFIFYLGYSQNGSSYDKFRHYSIIRKNDTINYYVYSPEKITETTGILLFIHGSGAFPMFSVTKEKGVVSEVSTMPFDLEKLPRDYAFVMVSKKCVPFVTTNQKYHAPQCYYENESLNYRVWQYDQVLNDIIRQKIRHPKKVAVIGHSEGSDVVAKLGTVNKKMTHIGFWSGSGSTQYHDFALMIRKEVSEGKTDESTAMKKLDSLYAKLQEIEAAPNNTSSFWQDNTYKRWHEFSEPAVENLLKINIPIFAAIGSKDQAVPIESTLLIRSEFIRKHKKNLTFKIYPGYDHGFETVPDNPNEEPQDMWMSVFREFMEWVGN